MSPRARSTLRRALRWAGIALAVVLALVLTALVAARLVLTDERLAQLVRQRLDTTFAGHFDLEAVHWRLPAQLEVQGLRVRTPEESPVLSVERASFHVRLLPLLSRRVSVRDLEATGVDVRSLSPGGGAPSGLARAFSPATPAPPEEEPAPGVAWSYAFSIDHITRLDARITDGADALVLEGARLEDARLVIDEDRLSASGEVTVDRFAVRTEALSHRGGPATLSLDDLSITESKAGTVLEVGAAQLALDSSRVKVEGRVQGLGGGELVADAELNGVVELADPLVQRLLAPFLPATGPSSGKARISLVAEPTEERGNRLTLQLDAEELSVGGLALRELTVKADYRAPRVVIEQARLDSGGGTARLSGWIDVRGRLAHELSLYLDDFPVRAASAPWLAGAQLPRRMSGTVSLSGPGLRPLDSAFAGALEARGLPRQLALLPDPLEAQASGSVRPEAVEITQLVARGAGATLTGQGRLPLRPLGDLALKLRLQHPGAEGLLRNLPLPFPVQPGEIDLEVDVGGTLRRPQGRGRLRMQNLRYAELPPVNVDLPFSLRRGELRVERGRLELAGGVVIVDLRTPILDARGELRRDAPLTGTVTARDIALARLPAAGAQGTLHLRGELAGTIDAPRASFAASVDELALADVRFATARAKGTVSTEQLRVTELRLERDGGGSLVASGDYDLRDRAAFLVVRARDAPLTMARPFVGDDLALTGLVDADATLRGTLPRPAIDVRLVGRDLGLGPEALGRMDARVTGPLDALAVSAALRGPRGDLRLRGVVDPLQRRLRAALEGDGLTVAPLAAALGRASPIDATAQVRLYIGGALPWPDVVGEVVLSGVTLEGVVEQVRHPMRLCVLPGGEAETYVLNLGFGPVLSARAVVQPAPLAIDVEARFTDLVASALMPRLREADVDLVTSGHAALEYRREEGAWRGTVSLDRLDLVAAEQALRLRDPIVARFERDRLVVPAFALEGPSGSIRGIATLTPERLEAALQGTLNLEQFAPLVPALGDARGSIRLDIRASGRPDAPEVIGWAIPRDVRFRPRGLAHEFTLTAGRVVLRPDELVIDDLGGRIDTGRFTIDGAVGLTGLRPSRYGVRLRGESLPLRGPDFVAEANADLRLTGRGVVPDVEGRVTLLRGRYSKSFALRELNFVAREPPEVEAPLAARVPWLRDVRLDVQVTNAEPVDLRVDATAFVLELGLDVDLSVTGTPIRPLVLGRISADGGSLELPYETLEVRQAIVDFRPTLRATSEALIQVVAEGEVTAASVETTLPVPTYFVTMTLEGDLDQMNIELAADPPLSSLEVLTLLVTGQVTLADVGAGDPSDRSAAELDAAIALAGSRVTGPLSTFVEQELARRLNLELDLAAAVTAEGFRVQAAKELTGRLRLEGAYERSFAEAFTLTEARASLLLTDRLFLEGLARSTEALRTSAALNVGLENRLQLKYRILGN